MKLLEDKIRKKKKILHGSVLKVSSFLNHQMDPELIMQLGEEFGRRFANDQVSKILTIESSGIALALAAGVALRVPVVFAKKSATAVLNNETVQAPVYSFTHKTHNTIRIERRYLPAGSRVLIIDDFLADGQAVHGLMSVCEQQKATVVGVGIAVEKGFQPGGNQLREAGVHLKSLAIVDGIENGVIRLRPDDD